MKLNQRVIEAAQAVLKHSGIVGPLELLQQLEFLHPVHFQEWLRGSEFYPNIESRIQCGDTKLSQTYRIFLDWVHQNNLIPIEGVYQTASRHGPIQQPITTDGNPERELFLRTQYRPANLPPAKLKRLEEKQQKQPELTVFQVVTEDSTCSQCKLELLPGSHIFLEMKQPLCLSCADLDHLEFLPSGDSALTRRTKKYSTLSAVVVRFNRSRKRYERQGILATSEAIARAEAECLEDAEARAQRRKVDANRRLEQDKQFVIELTAAIRTLYPLCPQQEAGQIAAHTALRGSGRVGRSAAGRALDEQAVHLATRAWIRHQHTNYDKLLMEGLPRDQAREEIHNAMEQVVQSWL